MHAQSARAGAVFVLGDGIYGSFMLSPARPHSCFFFVCVHNVFFLRWVLFWERTNGGVLLCALKHDRRGRI